MLTSNERILFIDAFAGPGEYSGGQQGSPVIALEAFLQHGAQSMMHGQMDYMFIEKCPDRKLHLDSIIAKYVHRLPQNCSVEVIEGTFTAQLSDVLNAISTQNAQLAPSFVMVDPFGVSDTPMSLIQRILSNDKSEVYVTLMYDHIQRLAGTPEFQASLDSLFGTAIWRDGIAIADKVLKKRFFFELYKSQLKQSAKYVLHFELYRGARLVYALFFATSNEAGCDKMKQAMWKVSPISGLRFTGGMENQFILGPEVIDLSPLQDDLWAEFEMNQELSIDDLLRFMRTDKTVFHSGHLKGELVEMENAGKLIVDENTRKRKLTYPSGTRLMFVEAPPPSPEQGRLSI